MEVNLKGFDNYKIVNPNGEVWYDIYDTFSPEELLKCVEKCLSNVQEESP